MTLVVDLFKQNLPPKARITPSGWTSFNAVCCHHRGEAPDDRKRGGVNFNQGLVYHCFNCGFTASWKPGRQISFKLKELMKWLGAPDDDINKMVFEAMRSEAVEEQAHAHPLFTRFPEKELPANSLPMEEWIDAEIQDHDLEQQLAKVVKYVVDRGFDPLDRNFYWTPELGFRDRVIIPFKYDGKIVGYTARKVTDGKPKYLSDQHPNYVFNIDSVTDWQNYVFVVEGPFDALSIGGMALLHNELGEEQARLINKLGKTVIVIPDQDQAGLKLIDDAVKQDWMVAFPTWDPSIKDCAAAVEKYGSLFVIIDAISTAVAGNVKIQLYKKKLEKALKNPSVAGSL
jgi:hypothetical protein